MQYSLEPEDSQYYVIECEEVQKIEKYCLLKCIIKSAALFRPPHLFSS